VNRRSKLLRSVTCAVFLFAYQLNTLSCLAAESENVQAKSDAEVGTTRESAQEAPRKIAFASTSSAKVLTPGAREAATLMGILPSVEKLMALQAANPNREMGQYSDQEIGLKVDLMDKIMGGCLEVRVVSDRIDRELAWSWSSKGMLEAKRQKRLNYLFTANFMQGGILGVLSGPAFLHGENHLGSELLLVGSSIGLVLSGAAFLEARSGSKPIDGGTTVLANVFQLSGATDVHHPEVVIKFLNAVPPDAVNGKTRREELIDSWKRAHYLRSTQEKLLNKLSVTPEGEQYKENIGLIGARIRMLFDCQWTLEQLDGDFLDLLRALD
jgi:hypothetical protein